LAAPSATRISGARSKLPCSLGPMTGNQMKTVWRRQEFQSTGEHSAATRSQSDATTDFTISRINQDAKSSVRSGISVATTTHQDPSSVRSGISLSCKIVEFARRGRCRSCRSLSFFLFRCYKDAAPDGADAPGKQRVSDP
jgi:hypothetical protein